MVRKAGQGFIVTDFFPERDNAIANLRSWVAAGRPNVEEDMIDGQESTPRALVGLLAGENRGNRVVEVA